MTSSSPAPSLTAVVSQFPAPSETFILRKLEGLRREGVRVQVAASVFTDGASATGFELLPLLPWSDLRHPARARRSWQAVASAASSRRSDGPPQTLRERITISPLLAAESDIVHFEFSGNAVTYRHAFDQLRPARIVVSCRGAAEQIVPLEDPSRIPLLGEVFHGADLIHCVSDDIRRTVIELGAPADKIVVNRPAVPVADFAPLAQRRTTAATHQGFRVLSIGRLHWKKGFDDALRAMAELRRSVDVEYRIAGEGAEREKLAFMINELGLGDCVTLLGTRTQDQVKDQLEWADALLLPSLSEGISNAVLEAMAAGLPVVSTTCGGMQEVIDDSVDGYLVAVGDTTAMADRLAALGRDQDLRHRLGAAAALRAAADFDVSRQVDIFLRSYRSVMSG